MTDQNTPIEPELVVELDKPRTMRLDFNALARFEEQTGIDLMNDEVAVLNLSPVKLRALVWATLIDDDPQLTVEAVGRILSPANLAEIATALVELQMRAFGGAEQQPASSGKVEAAPSGSSG